MHRRDDQRRAGPGHQRERGSGLGLLPARWSTSLSQEGLEVRTIQRAANGGSSLALGLVQALKSRDVGTNVATLCPCTSQFSLLSLSWPLCQAGTLTAIIRAILRNKSKSLGLA